MPTKKQIEFLREHLPYEMCMLRYAFQEIGRPREQLDWNVHLESFAIHARSLVEFLLNKEDQHSRTVLGSDLVPGYTAPEKDGVDHFMTKVNQQIAHLGTTRTREAAKKIGPERAQKALDWIEKAMERYLDAMRPDIRNLYNDAGSYPVVGPTLILKTGQEAATNALHFLTTSLSSTVIFRDEK